MEKFVKIFGTVIILILCGAFIIRCFMVADKSAFAELSVTPEMTAAYAAGTSGEDLAKTVEVVTEISPDGYFSAYGFYYIPAAGQAQVAVRWNDSVYGYTAMAEGTEFEFELLNETTGARYPARTTESEKKTIYNYRKLIIDNVEIGDTDRVVIVMKLRDGFTSEHPVRYGEQPWEEVKLSKAELKQLAGE